MSRICAPLLFKLSDRRADIDVKLGKEGREDSPVEHAIDFVDLWQKISKFQCNPIKQWLQSLSSTAATTPASSFLPPLIHILVDNQKGVSLEARGVTCQRSFEGRPPRRAMCVLHHILCVRLSWLVCNMLLRRIASLWR